MQGRLDCFINLNSFTKPVARIAMIFTSVQQNDDFMKVKLNISGPSLKNDHTSAIAEHNKTTGHNIKWDHFNIFASGKTDCHCRIKETLFIQELKPSFNVNLSEKLILY